MAAVFDDQVLRACGWRSLLRCLGCAQDVFLLLRSNGPYLLLRPRPPGRERTCPLRSIACWPSGRMPLKRLKCAPHRFPVRLDPRRRFSISPLGGQVRVVDVGSGYAAAMTHRAEAVSSVRGRYCSKFDTSRNSPFLLQGNSARPVHRKLDFCRSPVGLSPP
jgi:hypothetical protein